MESLPQSLLDPIDLYDHLNAEPHGHVWRSYGELKDKDAVFQCLYHGCARVKKGASQSRPTLHVCDYEQLNATPGNTPIPNGDHLTSNWLANGEGNHGDQTHHGL
uniref:Uncharacterized protein n=1 Tax=Tetranychus urticae TaxID=32264 RepID=T1KTY8_TETUR